MVRAALRIFCRNLTVNGSAGKGPLLIVANHPNSFLDALIIGSLFDEPVHFLARGDVFHKSRHNKLLRELNMIPVYRLSEGKENLYLNETAFKRSAEILSANGIVLIFIEGICVNKHALQPFKKGAARIALANAGNKNLKILPVAIAYNSFHLFGKDVRINIGEPIRVQTLFPFKEEAKNIHHFNNILREEIRKRILVPANKNSTATKQKWFLLPGKIGYVLHFPLYMSIKNFVQKKTAGTVFFDSVLFGTLLLIYPFYLLLLCLLLLLLNVSIIWTALIILVQPLMAWFAIQCHQTNKKHTNNP